MAELPEITILARQMTDHLAGLRLSRLELGRPEPLDQSPAELHRALVGRRLERAAPLGKWLLLFFEPPGPNLLIHPGMGMDLLALEIEPEKPLQHRFLFGPELGFGVRFWWMGRIGLARPGEEREAAGGLGPAPLGGGLTPTLLAELMERRKRSGIKAFLLNQKLVAGIGNFYVQDILFRTKAHPLTRIGELSSVQRETLPGAIEATLGQALDRGINHYEYDFWGQKGDWTWEAFLVGYKEGLPCPACGRAIQKIRACSSASYICPACQPPDCPSPDIRSEVP